MTDLNVDMDTDQSQRLADKLFADTVSALETTTVYLGVKLGLYQTLYDLGEATVTQFAGAAGVHRRYAREWLEQQAVSGLIDAVEVADDPYRTTFQLPPAHVPVLLEEESPLFLAPASMFMAGIGAVLPQLLEAFRTGAGVPFAAYGEDISAGIAMLSRPMFHHGLTESWLSTMPDIKERLARDHATVLDLGCGRGWSTITLAEAFPTARVHGLDLDPDSVEEARRNAHQRGLAGRVVFTCADAASLAGQGPFNLACVFEALHDMADPVGVLAAVRPLLAADGAVLIGDEKVADTFTAPGDVVERFNYVASVLHCLPATRAEGARVEAGTVLRAGTVATYAREAGYRSVQVLEVDHDLWRFYRLNP
jgi:SAM-dependent methyltransferase